MNEVERETMLEAPPDEVWESLTDPARLSDWFGAEVKGTVEPGGTLTFVFPDGTERRGLVEIADAPNDLIFRWLPFESTPDGRTFRRESSRVAIHLEPIGSDTLIRITETRVGSAGTPLPEMGFRPRGFRGSKRHPRGPAAATSLASRFTRGSSAQALRSPGLTSRL